MDAILQSLHFVVVEVCLAVASHAVVPGELVPADVFAVTSHLAGPRVYNSVSAVFLWETIPVLAVAVAADLEVGVVASVLHAAVPFEAVRSDFPVVLLLETTMKLLMGQLSSLLTPPAVDVSR